jgi:hypothetical protein
MVSTYLVALAAMMFAALAIVTIVKVVDTMWHLGE